MGLMRLIYSSWRLDDGEGGIEAILHASRRNNERDGLTGALVVGERHFLQILEGSRGALGTCMTRIMRDPRHEAVEMISAGEVPYRLFADWNMHRIDTAAIKRRILGRYLVAGAFRPPEMPQAAIEDLCRTLATQDWRESAA
jgi:hypothetical protein